MDRKLGRRRVMGQWLIASAVALWYGVLSTGIGAAERPCVAATLLGVDRAFEEAVRDQLSNELGEMLVVDDDRHTCWQLVIEMTEKRVSIALDGRRAVRTDFRLDEIHPRLWPRAIALSSVGLLDLSEEPAREERAQTEAAPSREEAKDAPRAREAAEVEATAVARDSRRLRESPGAPRPSSRLSVHASGGARLVPKLWAGFGEALPGIGVRLGRFSPRLSLIGLLGRKTTEIGRVHTAGVGARLTLWGRLFSIKQVSFALGPAVEALFLWGYGREEARATAHTASAPVLNGLLMLSGTIALARRIHGSVLLGGGWSVVYFRMQADEEVVSGMDGGFLSLAVGLAIDI